MTPTVTPAGRSETVMVSADAEPIRILVVDDETPILNFLSKLLGERGYVTCLAQLCSEAEKHLQSERYSLLLTDLSLPDGSGINLIRKAKSMDPETPCILITGHGSMESAVDAIHADAFAYISKPLDIQQLVSAIENGLEKRRLQIENRRLIRELREERELLQTRIEAATRDLSNKLHEVEKLNTEITILYEIVREMRGELRISESLDRLVSFLSRGIAFDSACWLILDPSDRILSCRERETTDGSKTTLRDLSLAVFREMRALLDRPGVLSTELTEFREWLLPHLGGDLPAECLTFAPVRTSSGLTGFVGLVGSDRFGSDSTRLLNLSVSLLGSLWDENTVIQRGSQMASIGELTAEVVHDLRNGLSAFRHIAQRLLNQVDLTNPKNLEYRDVLFDNLARTEHLIGELLTFGGLEEGFAQTTPVQELFDRVLTIARNSLEKNRIRVSIKVEREEMVVLGSTRELSEGLLNVVVNSIQAMKTGGDLLIEARSVLVESVESEQGERSRYVSISVTDTGEGIAPENLDRVFGRYFTTKKEGTGLGLSRLQKVVRKYLGRVEIRSKLGMGTTVVLLLPEV